MKATIAVFKNNVCNFMQIIIHRHRYKNANLCCDKLKSSQIWRKTDWSESKKETKLVALRDKKKKTPRKLY